VAVLLGVDVAGGTTEVLVGVRLGVRVFVGEGGPDVKVAVGGPGVGVREGVLVAAPVAVRVGVLDAVGVREAVGVGPVAVLVGVAVRVGVRDGVTVAMVNESETVQPLVKLSVTVQLPRIPPTGTPSKSMNQVIVELPGWTTLVEPLVGGVSSVPFQTEVAP
jgi:hypothetical protein